VGNTHLLFWLSLIPFTTGWIGENGFAELPVALYTGGLSGRSGTMTDRRQPARYCRAGSSAIGKPRSRSGDR